MSAEVLYDALHQVTGTLTSFPGAPPGMHARELPDNGSESYFLAVFGKPQNHSACECERSGEATLAQALHLLNAPEIQAKLSDPAARPARFAADTGRSDAEKIDEIYWTALARAPSAEERQLAVAHLVAVRCRRPINRPPTKTSFGPCSTPKSFCSIIEFWPLRSPRRSAFSPPPAVRL